MADTETRSRIERERAELVRNYEKSTVAWFEASANEGRQLIEERHRIAERLRDNYWKLDPYVRARTLYDRAGILREGGKLEFYPSVRAGPQTSADDVD